jgi:hypothetical protein
MSHCIEIILHLYFVKYSYQKIFQIKGACLSRVIFYVMYQYFVQRIFSFMLVKFYLSLV